MIRHVYDLEYSYRSEEYEAKLRESDDGLWGQWSVVVLSLRQYNVSFASSQLTKADRRPRDKARIPKGREPRLKVPKARQAALIVHRNRDDKNHSDPSDAMPRAHEKGGSDDAGVQRTRGGR